VDFSAQKRLRRCCCPMLEDFEGISQEQNLFLGKPLSESSCAGWFLSPCVWFLAYGNAAVAATAGYLGVVFAVADPPWRPAHSTFYAQHRRRRDSRTVSPRPVASAKRRTARGS
jgi:hypothetical protein